jgi:hypothetical protein
VLVTSWKFRSGLSAWIWSSTARTFFATSISLEPRVRDSENATTGLPSSSATWLGSAAPSLMLASDDRRSARPSGRLIEKSRSAAASSMVPTVRITCCAPAISVLPPGRSAWMRASCCDTCPAVMP